MGAGEGCGGKTRARAKKDRKYIPAMPMPVAVICCIFNFLVPGLGTILAGLCVCCCARTEDMSCCEQFGSFCLSIIIGLLQLVLAPVLLVGWVWSCFWGVSFIGMSKEYYHDNKPFDDEQVNTVVTNQPGPSGYHPGQWSSPPGGPYSAQPGPGPGYPQGAGYQGQSVSHGQFAHNSPMPTAPPEEHEYLPPSAPAGYPEAPPPYQIDDPHPHSNPHKH